MPGSPRTPSSDPKQDSQQDPKQDPKQDLKRALRVSRAVNRVRQLPTVFVANPLLASFVALIYWDLASHEFLLIVLAAMLVLITPAVMSWLRLKDRLRPEDVSIANERRSIAFSLILGLIWATIVWVLYPLGGIGERATLVIVMAGMTGGAIAFFSFSPVASLGFFVPYMLPLLVQTLRFDTGLRVLPVTIAVYLLTSLLFTRTAWLQFLATVGLIVERDQALAEAKASGKQLEIALSRMQDLAMVDELTGLKNRRAFFDDAEPAVAAARRRSQPIAVALLDLDFFKDVNDTYGHAAGDLVLKEVAHRITSTLREEQIVGRLGGEEFVALLPDTTAAQALIAIERVRRAVGANQIQLPGGGPAITVTISGGIALVGEEEGLETVIDLADKAMYRAKGLGRDRVEVFGV